MDWTSSRTLTKSLGDLLGQHDRNEHREPGQDSLYDQLHLKDEWWVGVRGVAASLARELNLGPQEFEHATGTTGLVESRFDSYMRQVKALRSTARKLWADLDAVTSAAHSASTAGSPAP